MENIIKSIDDKIQDMKKDSSIGITPINELLIKLAKERGSARKLAKNYKTSYEMDVIKKKEDREKELIDGGATKVTETELTRYAERELQEDYNKYREQEALNEYLEPIVNAYINHVNGVKFDTKEGIKVEKFNKQEDDLPF